MRLSGQLFGIKVAQSLGVHGNNQVRPCSSHVSTTESKGTTTMQKPGNNAFGLSRQVVHKKQLRAEGVDLCICTLWKFFYNNLACM